MTLRLPIFKQKGRPTCGPCSLRGILHYLGKDISQADLEKLIDYKETKGTSPIKIALAAKKLGFDVELKTASIIPPKEHFEMDYYKKYADEDRDSIIKLAEEAGKLGVKLTEKSVTQKQLLSLVNRGIAPLVLVNWNTIKKKPGFNGHYVTLVGFNNRFIYVNNTAGKNGVRMQAIPQDSFEKARKSKGTDEHIILISKPAKKKHL